MRKNFKFLRTMALALALILSFTALSACQTGSDSELVHIDDNYDTYYEVFVYSFADSDGDGIGDFKGLTEKLDYINDGDDSTTTDLGATAIWLMPINPSPTYHKYDVIDYKEIDPEYGTLEDFDNFLEAAHERGIKVIIDLVMNHSSNEHPWFQEAYSAIEAGDMDNKYIDYYFFDTEKKGDSWYQVGNTDYYYEGMFWSGMPDINLDNEDIKAEFTDIMEFWLTERNVDGFRLDAVKEFDSGNPPHNIEILAWINETAKSIKEDAYIVGEAWDSFNVIKDYYTSGIDSFFDFPMAEQGGIAVGSINRSNGQNYAENAEVINQKIWEINPDAINASFLSNHDTGRLAGFLASDENKLRLAAAINIFTTGNSFIYYGEEIGMRGAGRDENKRAYMYWGDEDQLQTDGAQLDERSFGYPFGSVEDQAADPNSLLNHYIKAIRINQMYPEISRGLTVYADEITELPLAPIYKAWTDAEGEEHEVLLVFNLDIEAVTTDLSATDYAEYELVAQLENFEGEQITLEEAKLNLPPATVAILKPAN